MTLLHADFLYYGTALFIIALIAVIRDGRIRKGMLRAIFGARSEDPAFFHLSKGRRSLRFLLLFAALILAAFAAARPAWGTESVSISGRGRDVLVIFDVSKSMLASDVAPSRLEHAKYFLSQLVKGADSDRFALISFAGNAFLECPFTADKVSFLQYVDELSCDSIPLGGTNLERALQAAEEAFRSAETPNKAVVLLTDGEELSGSAESTFAALKKLNIPLFVVGIGDPAVPSLIPLPNQQFLRDRKGEMVKTKLNEPLLKKIAETSGGLYFNSTAADSRLDAVVKAIESREKGLWEKDASARMIEHPEWFVGLAALALLLALLLPERAKAGVALLVLCLGVSAPAGTEPAAAKKTDAASLYNAAREKQLAADPAFAAGYETVLKDSQDADLTARALHNLAAGRHQEAETALQKARSEVQSQQLDPALKTLEQAIASCDGAKELYRQSLMKKSGISARTSGGNLQRLANDRAAAEELKKKIEELKKQQQKAQDQTRKAKEENQQKKDSGEQKKEPQKNQPEKQPKQDQKEQQKEEEKKEQNAPAKPQSGKSEMEKAQQEVNELQKQAEALQQKQQSEQAKQARAELEKAQQAQQKQDRRAAEKHLDEALKKLGENPASAEKQKPSGEKDKKEQSAPQKGAEKQSAASAASAQQKKDEKEHAARMVELLSGDEKDLRDALKAQVLRNSPQPEVEKDW